MSADRLKLETLLDRVHGLANQKGLFLREILWRRAGWGIKYKDPARESDVYKGEFVQCYKPTLRLLLRSEQRRLSGLPDKPLRGAEEAVETR